MVQGVYETLGEFRARMDGSVSAQGRIKKKMAGSRKDRCKSSWYFGRHCWAVVMKEGKMVISALDSANLSLP